jgi:hypothetical protein
MFYLIFLVVVLSALLEFLSSRILSGDMALLAHEFSTIFSWLFVLLLVMWIMTKATQPKEKDESKKTA